MSFFFDTIQIPFWFIVFIFASAAPLWIKWSKLFHKKFIATGILDALFRRAKSTAETKIDVLKKATDHWNENNDSFELAKTEVKKSKAVKTPADKLKKKNIKLVLTVLAEAGEVGILPRSIADKIELDPNETGNALKYLTEKEYAEVINSTSGTKYYLTELGRKYCLNKKYI